MSKSYKYLHNKIYQVFLSMKLIASVTVSVANRGVNMSVKCFGLMFVAAQAHIGARE